MSENSLQTPLYAEHLALGARMVPFAGWAMPVQYAGIIEEHKAVRASAGVFDVCHMAEFRIFGPGALEALQMIVTNDLEKIAELGAALYTVMCDQDGGIIDDLIVYHTGDLEYLIIANASNRQTDWDWITSHLPEGLETVDESDRTGLIALQGPKAIEIITELAGDKFELPERFHIAEAVLGGDLPVLLARTGYTGEDGVEILCHESHAVRVWRLLLSFAEVSPCGLGARDTLRLEMGYPLYGSDMDRGVDPISAGLGWVVPKTKSGYIGAEAIARIRERGVERKLVGLVVSDGVPRHEYPVLHEGTEVGKVASGTFSPTLGHGIATAYVPVDLSAPGTELVVAIRKKESAATVVRPPFVKQTSLSALKS
ncbi:MAG: glycine cleavage system aminomethyltransferase GcvT [Actinomycetota bacterium]|nr:glycine cleavage system aminomethyltransferase GcvT [Actinomycetota bacterium]MDP3630372.1 glycine cleavage system aminomethyltransferase GcvT [Actinomycetota bacterium]